MRILNVALAMLLLATGLALVWFGGELALSGGSLYYLPAGLALIATAWLIWKKSRRALTLFGIFWFITLIWSLWESGLNGWALAPRLAMFSVIGLWMMTPWFRRSLGLAPATGATRGTFVVVLLAILGGLGWIFWNDRITGGTDLTTYASGPVNPADGEWPHYGNDQGGTRYSPLAQITAANVGALERAWSFHTGPAPAGGKQTFEAVPLKVGDRLYFCTGYNDIVALDAETGKQVWRHYTKADTTGVFGRTCRGVSYYKLPDAAPGGECSERIYVATIDARLIAVDAATGNRCSTFGNKGEVDLRQGMGDVIPGYYYVTSPPAVVRGNLVLGGWVSDGQMVGEPSGVIRAFDAVTGAFAWAFDIGRPDFHGMPEPGKTFTRGTPNSWTPMSADEELGLVYAPTGNATPDYFGGHRSALMDKYSSSIIALDADTGAVRWSFQTTHHDLWDYDVASPPTLVNLADGRPAVLQPTKRGEIFMLDRRTGQPIADVTEKPVPVSDVPGERSSPTQPFSTGLPNFRGPEPSERTMWGLTPIDQAYCRVLFRRARFEGTLTPVGLDRPTITWPGYLGGNNWGGVSVDPKNGIMFVNSTHVVNYNKLLSREKANAMGLKPITPETLSNVGGPVAQQGVPVGAHIKPFLSPLAVPCQQPPYGLVSAVDLNTRKLLWQRPLGTARDSGPLMMSSHLPIPMGLPNIGGSVITASGLVFIGAAQEHMLRAYDLKTGKELWKGRLPAGGQATPMTYWSDKSGRQFVVMAAGGHGGLLSGESDEIIAYALPRKQK